MDSHDWDTRYAGDELLWGSAASATVVEQVTSVPAGRALDLGCGEGRNALWLATRGWQVTAVDFSAVALNKAQRSAAPLPRSVRGRIDWALGNVTNLEFGTDYDLALAVYLHLCPDERAAVLRRAVAALRPGGILLILDQHPDPDRLDDESHSTAIELEAALGDLLTITVAVRRVRETEQGPAVDNLVVGFRTSVGS
ncbi:methyltransferase domain-containing protein [Rhodococcus spelaei]|uniref:Methyltransferase domain-containing protein n=1 Tax=Rhodococcus spelaei TaxID=2546320 RepID=A0A541BA21_9NOCA|nr:methyltransferase domain-containing protein [Rhodococcus spelaei]TQF69174.1 methyltransferase domain-containing protein [Rhodococcus spelaei]